MTRDGRSSSASWARVSTTEIPENNAVLAGLDLVDLINLRDALQQEIDNFALTALETQAMVGDPAKS